MVCRKEEDEAGMFIRRRPEGYHVSSKAVQSLPAIADGCDQIKT